MPLSRYLLAAFFMSVLASCAVLPDDRPAETSAGITIPDQQVYSPGTDAQLSADAVPEQWWRLFNDEVLAGLQDEAQTSNLDLQIAVARIEQSRAQLGLVASAQGIQADVSAAYTRSRLSEHSRMALLGAPTEPSNYWQLGVQASWELDLWGHLQNLTDAAGQRLLASHYDMESVRASVAADVARTYLLLRGVQAQQALAEDDCRIAADLLQLAQSREQNGVGTRYDTALARAGVAAARAKLPALSNQRDQLMATLALLLGKAPHELDAQLSQVVLLPAMPQQLPLGLPSELARRRPDILRAGAQLRAATADIGAARADFYPRISLNGTAGLEAFDFSDMGSWGSRTFSFGPDLYLPVFQGGRLRQMLELTENSQKTAAIRYQKTVLAAWHEVVNALNTYQNEQQRHQALTEACEQSELARHTAQRAYEQGHASRITVLNARRVLLLNRQAQADSATAAALSVVALYRALGGGWSAALAPETQPLPAAAGLPEPARPVTPSDQLVRLNPEHGETDD